MTNGHFRPNLSERRPKMTYEGEGKRHKWRMKKMLLLTAPAGRNNKVRVMDVVWLVKKNSGECSEWYGECD